MASIWGYLGDWMSRTTKNPRHAWCLSCIVHIPYQSTNPPQIGRANICLTCTTSDAPTYSGVCDMLICRYNVVSTPILAILQYGPFSGCYNSVRLSRQLSRVPTSIWLYTRGYTTFTSALDWWVVSLPKVAQLSRSIKHWFQLGKSLSWARQGSWC